MHKAFESAGKPTWAIARLFVAASLLHSVAAAQPGVAPPDPKPSVTPPRASSLPGRMQAEQLFIKPGHWLSARIDVWTGEQELRGTLGGGWTDFQDAPLTYPPLRYVLRSEQPVLVPKESDRALEALLFVPNDPDAAGRGFGTRDSRLHDLNGQFRIASVSGFGTSPEIRRATTALRDHQALFVVLAARPSDYAWLDKFDAISASHTATPYPEYESHYRLVVVDDPVRAPLPSTLLGWTTTSHLLWDGYDLARLTDEQRTALVDWVHWGGTLIVAGPGTIDLPAGDSLRSWLPVAASSVREFAPAALAPLAKAADADRPLSTPRNWSGLQLEPDPSAIVTLGTTETPLVVERRLGRGRIVVTAFRPVQSELLAWPAYGGFFHNYLMRRSPRFWAPHPSAGDLAIVMWNDTRQIPMEDEARRGFPDAWFEPGRISSLRFFGRGDITTTARRTLVNLDRPLGPGVAAVRDDDEISQAARDAIQASAGIFIPSVSAVAWLVGGYVLVAVPLNWLVFKSLGKPEWAWGALPVLAVLYTIVIIRAAELDLGFVRSSSEMTLVEVQPGYDRAHVTRFVSLFNSLGTEYQLVGEEPTTVTLPFPMSRDAASSQSNYPYRLVQGQDAQGRRATTLVGTVVDSNSVAAVRSEQMTPLGGTLTATYLDERRVQIANRTLLELRNVQIADNGGGGAAVAVIAPGASLTVELTEAFEQPPDDPAVDAFRDLFKNMHPPGTLWLTALTPTEFPGLRIDPTPSQRRRTTLVAAVLQYPIDPLPGKDPNTRRMIESKLIPNP